MFSLAVLADLPIAEQAVQQFTRTAEYPAEACMQAIVT